MSTSELIAGQHGSESARWEPIGVPGRNHCWATARCAPSPPCDRAGAGCGEGSKALCAIIIRMHAGRGKSTSGYILNVTCITVTGARRSAHHGEGCRSNGSMLGRLNHAHLWRCSAPCEHPSICMPALTRASPRRSQEEALPRRSHWQMARNIVS